MGVKTKLLITLFFFCGIASGCDLIAEKTGVFCNAFQNTSSIKKAIKDNPIVVSEIEKINPGFDNISIEEFVRCPGKSRLVILYATEQDRQKIKKLIGDTFFGIQYRMQNV